MRSVGLRLWLWLPAVLTADHHETYRPGEWPGTGHNIILPQHLPPNAIGQPSTTADAHAGAAASNATAEDSAAAGETHPGESAAASDTKQQAETKTDAGRKWQPQLQGEAPPTSAADTGGPDAGHRVRRTALPGASPDRHRWKGQFNQDQYVSEDIFKGKRNGVFVDLGCFDGVTYSNSWVLEQKLGWKGICVEPDPSVYPRISSVAGRKSGVQVAVGDSDGEARFVAAGMLGSLDSGVDSVDDRVVTQDAFDQMVTVKTMTPASLLQTYLPGVAHVDYVNVDVEGKEEQILAGWPHESVCVDVFSVENNGLLKRNLGVDTAEPDHHQAYQAILGPRGYTHVTTLGVDEIFRRDPPCQ